MSKDGSVVTKETKFENAAAWLSLGIDFESRRMEFSSDVNDVMQSLVIRALLKMQEISNDPIEIYFSSDGGSLSSGLAIYDAIRACPCHIAMFGNGTIASAGTIIFLAGDTRVVSQNTRFMIHSVSGVESGKIHDMSVYVAEGKINNMQMANIYAERTKIKNIEFWQKKMSSTDYWFGIQEANELGFLKYPKPQRNNLTKKAKNGKIKKPRKNKQNDRKSRIKVRSK